MKTFEATGKTYEEALMAGLAQMGLPSEKVDVEVLEEGTKGFLGIGASPAKVKVTYEVPCHPRGGIPQERDGADGPDRHL